jgi:hypothetical protein
VRDFSSYVELSLRSWADNYLAHINGGGLLERACNRSPNCGALQRWVASVNKQLAASSARA